MIVESSHGVGGEDVGVAVAGITSHVCGPKKERPKGDDGCDTGDTSNGKDEPRALPRRKRRREESAYQASRR